VEGDGEAELDTRQLERAQAEHLRSLSRGSESAVAAVLSLRRMLGPASLSSRLRRCPGRLLDE
jgi:hypothetical protein